MESVRCILWFDFYEPYWKLSYLSGSTSYTLGSEELPDLLPFNISHDDFVFRKHNALHTMQIEYYGSSIRIWVTEHTHAQFIMVNKNSLISYFKKYPKEMFEPDFIQ